MRPAPRGGADCGCVRVYRIRTCPHPGGPLPSMNVDREPDSNRPPRVHMPRAQTRIAGAQPSGRAHATLPASRGDGHADDGTGSAARRPPVPGRDTRVGVLDVFGHRPEEDRVGLSARVLGVARVDGIEGVRDLGWVRVLVVHLLMVGASRAPATGPGRPTGAVGARPVCGPGGPPRALPVELRVPREDWRTAGLEPATGADPTRGRCLAGRPFG